MSEYLSEEEQVARLKAWWDENGTFVLVVTVLAVVAIVGWRWYGGYTEDQAFAASKLFDEYREADGEARKALAASIEAAHEGSAYHVFVLMTQAQEAVAADDLTLADIALSHAVEVARDALLADLARIRLAKVQFGLDRAEQALATLGGVRNEGYRAWALEAQGDIYAAQDNLEAAHESYSAAVAALQPGDERPLLNMKLDNLAPFDGKFVELSDPLDDALRDALEQVGTASAESEDAVEDAPEETFQEAAEEAAEQETEGNLGDAAEAASDTAPAPESEAEESVDGVVSEE